MGRTNQSGVDKKRPARSGRKSAKIWLFRGCSLVSRHHKGNIRNGRMILRSAMWQSKKLLPQTLRTCGTQQYTASISNRRVNGLGKRTHDEVILEKKRQSMGGHRTSQTRVDKSEHDEWRRNVLRRLVLWQSTTHHKKRQGALGHWLWNCAVMI